MDKLTPGRKLILDLLAKSVAKIQAAEAENGDENKKNETVRKEKKKRKTTNAETQLKKKIKAEKDEKENYNLDNNLFDANLEKCSVKNESKIKVEYKEIKTETLDHKNDVKDENPAQKLPSNKSFIMKLLKGSIAKYSGENDISSNVKEELDIVKYENKKENIDVETSNYNLDNIIPKMKTEDKKTTHKLKNLKQYNEILPQLKPIDLKPVPIKIKTEYTEIKMDTMDLKTDIQIENPALKQLSNESYIMKLLKGSIAKYSGENDISSNVKIELDIVKNEDKKENIKADDNLDVENLKYNLENIKPKVKTEAKKRTKKVEHNKPDSNSMKKEYTDIQSSGFEGNTENNDTIVKDHEDNKGRNKKHISGKGIKFFTQEEDQILQNAIERFGDKIDFAQVAKDLGRNYASIIKRIDKLKTGKSWKEHRAYTLAEDIYILDAVLKPLDEQSLEMLKLPTSDWKEIGAQIGREEVSPRLRWGNFLKPWIMQHYSGTLNLDIRRPLANYLADNFKDLNSIDWPFVTRKSEFAGHTQASLRTVFFSCLYKVKHKLNTGSEDISLEMVADFANTAYLLGGRKVSGRILTRQEEIINYFECYVKTNCITNF